LIILLLILCAHFTSECPAQQSEVAALEARAAELEQRIAALQQELNEIRDKIAELTPHPLTPYEALVSFERRPDKRITVEFGVAPIGYPSGLVTAGDDPEPAIIATWDNYFHGGGTLTAIVPPNVYRRLSLPTKDGQKVKLTMGRERQQVVDHIEKHGIRVTGVMQPGEGFSDNDFTIRVKRPEDVQLYIR
jgi:hypothetical protein